MRDWIELGIVFLLLIAVCFYVDWLWVKLETHHNLTHPIKEIVVRPRDFEGVEWMLMEACPDERGKLQAFLDCHTEVKKLMNRTDI